MFCKSGWTRTLRGLIENLQEWIIIAILLKKTFKNNTSTEAPSKDIAGSKGNHHNPLDLSLLRAIISNAVTTPIPPKTRGNGSLYRDRPISVKNNTKAR